MPSKTLRQNFLRSAVSLLFIAGCLYALREKWFHALVLLKQMDRGLFGLAALVFFMINWIVCLRLFLILKIERIRASFGRVVWLNFVGLFFNLFLPSSLGGDLVKAYYLSKGHASRLTAIACIVMDRLLGLAAMISMASVSLPFFLRTTNDPRLALPVVIFSASFFLFFFLLFNHNAARKISFLSRLVPSERGRQKFKEFYHSVNRFRHEPGVLGIGYSLSLMVQIASIVIAYLLAESLQLNVRFLVFLLVIPISALASMIPSLGGLGVREASIIYFLGRYTTTESAAAFALAFDILIYGFGLFCGILFAVFGGQVKEEVAKAYD